MVTARGVATEHVLGRKATPAPRVTSPYIKKMDWCKCERSEGQSRGTHPATTTQPAGKAHPKHPVLLHIAGTPNPRLLPGLSKYQTSASKLLRTFWYFFKAKDGSSKGAVALFAGQGRAGQGQGGGKRLVGRKFCTITHEPECHQASTRNNHRVKPRRTQGGSPFVFYFQL